MYRATVSCTVEPCRVTVTVNFHFSSLFFTLAACSRSPVHTVAARRVISVSCEG